MRPDYDFSKGQRGRFFHPNVKLRLPTPVPERDSPALDAALPPVEDTAMHPHDADDLRADTSDGEVDDHNDPDTTADGLDEGELHAPFSGEVPIDKLDRSLVDLKRLHDEGDLVVDPEWQRNYVWTSGQASKLIESFLLNIPVPEIYLARTRDNRYEVVDGLQRLTSVFRFLDNGFALTGLGIRVELNGKRFRHLEAAVQKKLKNSALRSLELRSDTNADLHFVVFERLNTGGTRLNEMEIRNCLYRGALNELVKDLAANEDFIKCVSEKTLSKRMKDRTFVLRFLAFHERTHRKCKAGIKKFLNDFLDTYRNPSEPKLQEYRDVFKKCMKASLTVFGCDGFRLKREDPGTTKSSGEWSTRSNVAIFQCVATSFADSRLGSITKNADRIYEEYLDLISSDATWVDYVRRATGEASRLEYVFETWQKRLRGVLVDEGDAGTARSFSRKLKKEFFDQDATCSICGNQIKLLDDAVIDHVAHYWRGGKTLPENARLAHRFCNLERGGQ